MELVLIFIAIALLADAVDIMFTTEGIHRGVGVEQNSLIVGLFGEKPTAFELVVADEIWIAPPALLGLLVHIPAVQDFAMGFLGVVMVKHIIGAYEWDQFMHGKKQTVQTSAFRKFLGL